MYARKTKLEELEKDLGYIFGDKGLLLDALTHKSYYHENRDKSGAYNERLEFLGDSVVGLVIVERLFMLEQEYAESVLAKMKSFLVSEPVLAEIAGSISLGEHLLLGKGEEATGGRTKRSVLADALEAVIGAVFLDGGYARAREIVLRFFRDRIRNSIASGEFYDYKTELQEKTQLLYGILPEYRVIKQQGKEHKRIFTVAVFLDGKRLGSASGKRKKEAETIAAQKALAVLRNRPEGDSERDVTDSS